MRQPVYATESKYTEWVASYRKEHPITRGACHFASKQLVDTFSELRLVRGYVHIDGWWHQHWWTELPNGNIVDATNNQWEAEGGEVSAYEEYDEEIHGSLPIGKCMDCGAMIYPEGAVGCEEGFYSNNFCNAICEASTRSYLGV